MACNEDHVYLDAKILVCCRYTQIAMHVPVVKEHFSDY